MRNEKIHNLLKNTFGHKNFRFDQLDIINSVLDGQDVLAIMPTGGGKSLCYQIPALYQEGITLVVSPLISLMHDQVLNLQESGVDACFLNSSQDYQEQKEIQEKILAGHLKIVYVSPEGLLSGHLFHFFKPLPISLVAIDEAHCVSQWGHEFRKDYTRLGELKKMFKGAPILALTATADLKTRQDISSQLKLDDPQVFISSFDRPNIKYSIYEKENEIKQLNHFILQHHKNETGIIYCLSRRKVEKVAKELKSLGHETIAYHAGLSSLERQKGQELFNKEDGIIVVATIAFGMGIDRPDVRFVAHLDLPKSIESYYQETGRAGRDGHAANAWMLFGLQDVVKLSQMIESTEAGEIYKKMSRVKLDSMLALCETAGCRRFYLLGYFGEESSEKCQNCDSCIEPKEAWDATEDAQKVLSTIFRTGQVFGAGHIIDVLRGSQNAKIIEKKHNQLSVYGIGKDFPKPHWNRVIRQLLSKDYIMIKNWEYRGLQLTAKSGEILKNQHQLKLIKQKQINNKLPMRPSGQAAEAHQRYDLFEELRALRRGLAEEKKVPPYVVFSDKSLHDMCLLMPRDSSEFLMVNGVGASKCENYSQAFLRKINEFS